MGNKSKTEEEIKKEIFSLFTECRTELSSDRRQVYIGRLCDRVFRWCGAYLFKDETAKMGVEIFDVIRRFVDNKENIPKEEKHFFNYLKLSLNKAKAEYYRSNEASLVKIPKGKSVILKNIEDAIRMEEHNRGRKLDELECDQLVFDWLGIDRSKYTKIINTKYIINYDEIDDSSQIAASPYNPQDSIFTNFNENIVRNAVESVLKSKQPRTKGLYRALFTIDCIEKQVDLNGMYPVLDPEILEAYQNTGIKPWQYEIYLKYHPDVKQTSAEVRASETLKTFLNDLYTEIKKKHPEINLH